jgi:predicted phosphodiesterase
MRLKTRREAVIVSLPTNSDVVGVLGAGKKSEEMPVLLAVIGDIVGNFPVIKALLAVIDEAGIETVAHTGNTVGDTEGNREILRILQEYDLVWVQGLQDRQTVRIERKAASLQKRMDETAFAAMRRAHASLSSTDLEMLRRLPPQRQLELDGVRVLVCHGAPSGQRVQVDAGTPQTWLQREREIAPVDIIVCGGSAAPFHRWVDGALFVGPGRADCGEGHAAYTVISTEDDPWSVHHLEITY